MMYNISSFTLMFYISLIPKRKKEKPRHIYIAMCRSQEILLPIFSKEKEILLQIDTPNFVWISLSQRLA